MSDRLGRRSRRRIVSVLVASAFATVALVTTGSAFGGGAAELRHHRHQRAVVGRVDREHVRREERAREAARLQGEDHERHRGHAVLPGHARRQDQRRAQGLRTTRSAKSAQPYLKDKSVQVIGSNGMSARHRLVQPALPAQAVPLVQDVEGTEGQGDRVQVPRVGLAGDVPRRRSVLCPEGSRAHQGARPQPQARRRRVRGRRRSRAGRSCTSRRSPCCSTGTTRSI